ncbi:unnamed protein product [Paramecium pentaurelia]|uniref:Major facilitator superfamily (MFS) profile domain-containing protein n=1 Tax=Paramecium pentaurelia TaxID=43138 RepID=A0A8S1V110_9CILI|nr:unnamed protein product [Paramecium pentaurelia]
MKKGEDQQSSGFLRYIILLLSCIALYGNMFIFDQPALLKEQIMQTYSPIYGEHLTSFYFSFMYSFYSIPNIILPLVGGFMSDIFGYRKMSIIFMFFVILGQGFLYFGSSVGNFKYMILGRFMFGLGGESLFVASSIIINKWFVGKELSFANALNLSLIRSATVLGTYVSPRIAEKSGMTTAFGVGFGITLISGASLLILNFIDSYTEILQKRNLQKTEGLLDNSIQVMDFKELVKQIFEDIGTFPKIFWILTLIMTTFYTSVLIFISFSSGIIIDLWLPADAPIEQNQEVAGELMGIPYLCCTFLSPFVGLMVDKVGQRIKFLAIGCALVFLGLVLMLLFYPIFCMLTLGLSYALFASTIWTSIAFVQNLTIQRGTAFGVMNSVQNFAFFLMPLFIAFISAEASSQVSVVLFFLILACVSLIIAIYLYIEDRNRLVSLNSNDQKKLMNYVNNQTEDGEEFEEEEIIETK